MSESTIPQAPGLQKAMAHLQSILVRDESLEAWAVQRRPFALLHRRLLVAATSGRLIAMTRGPFGGFEYTDLRWQDLKEAHLSVGILGATLRVTAEKTSDLASAEPVARPFVFSGLVPAQAQAVYRICQAQDQAWREKRRVREIEELRARAGGVQIVGGAPAAAMTGAAGDPVQRLEQARQMLAAKLITDAEYEAVKAKILSGA